MCSLTEKRDRLAPHRAQIAFVHVRFRYSGARAAANTRPDSETESTSQVVLCDASALAVGFGGAHSYSTTTSTNVCSEAANAVRNTSSRDAELSTRTALHPWLTASPQKSMPFKVMPTGCGKPKCLPNCSSAS